MNSQGGKECCTRSTIVCQMISTIDHIWYMINLAIAASTGCTTHACSKTWYCARMCTQMYTQAYLYLARLNLPSLPATCTLNNFVLVLLAILRKLVQLSKSIILLIWPTNARSCTSVCLCKGWVQLITSCTKCKVATCLQWPNKNAALMATYRYRL